MTNLDHMARWVPDPDSWTGAAERDTDADGWRLVPTSGRSRCGATADTRALEEDGTLTSRRAVALGGSGAMAHPFTRSTSEGADDRRAASHMRVPRSPPLRVLGEIATRYRVASAQSDSRELSSLPVATRVSRKCRQRGETRQHHGRRHREVVQRHQGLWVHRP